MKVVGLRKFEVRLENFLASNKNFVEGLKLCLEKFKEINDRINSLEGKPNSNQIRGVMRLRLEALKAFCDVLKRESELKHEKSHLLESYGELILSLEKTCHFYENKK